MNKIVREHYPVSRLPDDLKAQLGSMKYVRLVIEDIDERPAPSRETLLQLIEGVRRAEPIGDDPVERIRKLRDEWDD